MEVKNRDHARQLIARHKITSDNVTKRQLKQLWIRVSSALLRSDNYNGSMELNGPTGTKFMTCRTEQWTEREAVSFNPDGFIGFAGWADKKNIKPILSGVGEWLDDLET